MQWQQAGLRLERRAPRDRGWSLKGSPPGPATCGWRESSTSRRQSQAWHSRRCHERDGFRVTGYGFRVSGSGVMVKVQGSGFGRQG